MGRSSPTACVVVNASLNLRAARGIVIGAVVISAALMSWQVFRGAHR